MRDCPQCRHSMDADAAFCPHCGHSVAAAQRRNRLRLLRTLSRRWMGFVGLALLLAAVAHWLPERAQQLPEATPIDLVAARAARAEGDWQRLVRLVSPVGEVPAGAEARSLLAEALHERCLAEGGGGFERAARVRELSLADDPEAPTGLRARAELESSFGDPRRAVSWWEAALQAAERRPPEPSVRQDLLLDVAVARALVGEFGRAELLLEELLQERPDHPTALSNRGLLHLQAGRLRLAEADLVAALAIEPGAVAARAGLVETLRRRGGSDELLEPAARLEGERSDSLTAHHALALLAESRGEQAAAQELLRAALRLAPAQLRLRAELSRVEGEGP